MKVKRMKANQTEITLADGTEIFVSYETPVAAYVPGRGYVRTSKRHSATTTRHTNQWLDGVRAKQEPQEFFDGLI